MTLIERLREYAEDLRTLNPKSEYADLICEAIDALKFVDSRCTQALVDWHNRQLGLKDAG